MRALVSIAAPLIRIIMIRKAGRDAIEIGLDGLQSRPRD